MKKNLKFVAALAVVLLNTALIFAQEKTIEKEEFWKIVSASQSSLIAKPYRSVSIYEDFENGRSTPSKSSKSIFEAVPPDMSRKIEETGNQRKETIRIGSKRYIKLNNGPWKIDKSGEAYVSGGAVKIESESFKVTENILLDGKNVDLYEMKSISKDTGFGSDSAREITRIVTERCWISKDGLPLKSEREYSKPGYVSRYILIYEQDPNIKIENPLKRRASTR